MRGKKIAAAALLVWAWMPMSVGTLTTMVVAGGGAALVSGCAGSADRSDTRQDARTSTRTEQRVEDRRD
jgi:hypothetical protein